MQTKSKSLSLYCSKKWHFSIFDSYSSLKLQRPLAVIAFHATFKHYKEELKGSPYDLLLLIYFKCGELSRRGKKYPNIPHFASEENSALSVECHSDTEIFF